MAHSIQFSADYRWIPPGAIRSFETNLSLLRWFFTHAQVNGDWIKLDWLSKSDAELGELVRTVPDFGEAKRNLSTFRVLLFHLGTSHRFSDDQINQIDELISGWDDHAKDVLRRYSPDVAPNASGYLLLTEWAKKAELLVQYIQKKTAFACQIVETYASFRRDVDLLQPLMNNMVIGRTTKVDCQAAGGNALTSQEKCLTAIKSYFDTLPPYDDDPTLAVCLQTLVPGVEVADRTIVQLRTAKNHPGLAQKTDP